MKMDRIKSASHGASWLADGRDAPVAVVLLSLYSTSRGYEAKGKWCTDKETIGKVM